MAACSHKQLELFLQQQLSPQEEADLEAHLSQCAPCCDRLQACTAEEAWWNEARTLLPDAGDDLTLLSDCTTPGGHTTANDALPPAVGSVLQILGPTDDPQMLGRIGPYEVAGVVGAGGMSVVLKGFDRSLNRFVAIKVLAPHLATSGAARTRFSREAQAAAAIVHDNVIAIHGVDEALGLPYLVMPYVKGHSLQTRLDEGGPLELKEILRVATQTAAGLAAAHAQGLVHRDVKPANILLADGVERVTITDFGLARAADDASLTRSGTIAGTPQYMSPEQARGATIDQRSDLFSLGSVIYAMCAGTPPFRAESSYGVLRRITDEEPRPLSAVNAEIPDWLCRLVGKLHAKTPANRYPSAAAVALDLEQCLAHVQQPTREPLPERLQPPSPRIAASSFATWAVGALLTCLIALAIWGSQSPQGASADSETIPPTDTAPVHAAPADNPSSPSRTLAAEQVPHEETAAGSNSKPPIDDLDLELRRLEAALNWLESQLPP